MSILDKQGPSKCPTCGVSYVPGDPDCIPVAKDERDELLAALKRVGACCGCMDEEARALIERIENAEQTNQAAYRER